MKLLIPLLVACTPLWGPTQEPLETELVTDIDRVTVFLQSAQITRKGTVTVPAGRSRLVLKSLSPHLDQKSIKVEAEGDFTLLSIQYRNNFLHTQSRTMQADSLRHKLANLKWEILQAEARSETLEEKARLLTSNRRLAGDKNSIASGELQRALIFFEEQFSKIKSENITIQRQIDSLSKREERVTKQMHLLLHQEELPYSEIVVVVEADHSTEAQFEVRYLVSNAGWFPTYDLRVSSVEEPILLNYKAEVHQNTGVDWNDVRLRFSNAVPSTTGMAPKLSRWDLNFRRNTVYRANVNPAMDRRKVTGRVFDEAGVPLIGASVHVKGTTLGTVTDFDGNYALTVPHEGAELVVSYAGYEEVTMPVHSSSLNLTLPPREGLDEVVVAGLAVAGRVSGVHIQEARSREVKRISTTVIENQTTVEFEVDRPYTIPTDGQVQSIDVKELKMPAHYEYHAVPKLDKDAFLMAKIPHWDQHHLLEGEANLYFEDAYVGRSVLEAKMLVDTLRISLGRDRNIVVGRKRKNEFSRKRTVGTNRIDSRSFEIIVRNNKSQHASIMVHDQLPVPVINNIQVVAKELSSAKLDEKSGALRWELTLAPGQQQTIVFEYAVKYPKREQVVLE